MPIDISPPQSASPTSAPVKQGWNREIRFGAPKVTLEQRMVFTERLLLLLQTGVSLVEALHALRQQTEEPLLVSIIGSLADTVSEGKNFSDALLKHPEMFSTTYASLVAAAEQGGFMTQVLEQLLQMDEKNNRMRNDITAALSYPAFLIVFSIAVIIFVLVVIFPKFESLFASIHDQLPLSTLFLMAVSGFVRHYWVLIFIALGAAGWGTIVWAKSSAGKLTLDNLKMSVPVVKDIYTRIYLSQTLGVLGLSLSNGVPITVALKACQDVVNNSVFVRFLDDVREKINEGKGIASGFNAAPFIPPMVRQMIATGEQTGKIGRAHV
jgi:type II secretory pathway component PulF